VCIEEWLFIGTPCRGRTCHARCCAGYDAFCLSQTEVIQVLVEVGEQPAGQWAANMENEATHLSQVCAHSLAIHILPRCSAMSHIRVEFHV
jgi:hypothetical protein